MKQDIKLKGIANLRILEKFQRLFFKLTGLYTTFIDIEGNFITSDRGLRPFCLLIAKFGMKQKCDECNINACKKVVKLKSPLIYKCFAGLTEIISPIIVQGKVLGAVLTGQIRVKGEEEKKYVKIPKLSENRIKKLSAAYRDIPIITKEQIESAAQLLFLLINYIFKIEYEILVYKEITKYKTYPQEVVKKVIDYITSNYSKDICLKDISEKFNISQFYISRIFRKETGYSIMNYLTKIRMDNAVKLLKNPTIPIKKIAYLVGYTDEYYFHKVFKKNYQITPARFRKNYFSK